MSAERHLVARQVLVLHVPPTTDTAGLFDAVSDLFRDRLAAVIERCLDDLCPPGEVLRLDTLEVDLGTLRAGPGDLVAVLTPTLTRRLDSALRAALATELHRLTPTEPDRFPDLDLVDVFARHGALPWWGDVAVATTPADAFARAVGAGATDVADLLRRLPSSARNRLARVVTDADLERLLATVGFVGATRTTTVAADVALFRIVVEAMASWPGRQHGAEPGLAVRHGLLAGIVVAAEKGPPSDIWEAALLAAAATVGVNRAGLVSALGLVARPRDSAGGLGAVVAALAAGNASLMRTPRPAEQNRSAAGPDSAATAADRSLDLPDDIAVAGAGLVVLSPFLVHFLDRVGLLDSERREFRDERARSRAMAVLAYLTRAEDTVEHQLPLAKVLCGVDPAAEFDPGPGVTRFEADECHVLLSAVAAHLDVTGDLDAEELRARIVLRTGMLSRREGVWLLRVLPDPADRMLAGLAWSFEWVRLPWMPAPLVVEWRRDESRSGAR